MPPSVDPRWSEIKEFPAQSPAQFKEVHVFLKLPLGDVGSGASLEFLQTAESDAREMMQILRM